MAILKGRKLVSSAALLAAIIILSSFVPSFRSGVFAVLRFPLAALTVLKNEAGGIIFYHHNMVENRRLASDSLLLRRKLVDAEEVARENERLRALVGFKKDAPYKVIAARVIGKNPSNWSASLVIDRGSASGIRKGYVCVTYLGLCGRVVTVNERTSSVMLINDPSLCVSALIQRSRQEGLVCGSLSGVLLMKYLPKECDIRVSDTVISSGLTGMFPKGILIGTVSEIRDEFSGASRYAVVKPAVETSALEEVLVIIP